jgi:hypothetical protein
MSPLVRARSQEEGVRSQESGVRRKKEEGRHGSVNESSNLLGY